VAKGDCGREHRQRDRTSARHLPRRDESERHHPWRKSRAVHFSKEDFMRASHFNTLIVTAALVFPGCTCGTREVVVKDPPAAETTTTKVEVKDHQPPPPSTVIVTQPAPAATPAPATTVNVNR
jgi:hypothetical protein